MPPGSGRLYRSIYLHGLKLLALVAIAGLFAGVVLGRDTLWREFPGRLASHLARSLGSLVSNPERLQHELGRVKETLRVDVAVYDGEGRLLAATSDPPLPPLLGFRADGRLRRGAWSSAARLPGGGYLEVALPSPFTRFIRAAAFVLIVIIVLGLSSYPFARAIARPLERLGETAKRLGAGDLSARTGIKRSDEIGELASAFDDMAARLETLVKGERELLANLSHELRTPLARIQVALDLAGEGDTRYLREIEADLKELDQLIEDILATARFEQGGGVPALDLVPIRPETLLEELQTRFQPRHPGRVLKVTTGEGIRPIEADLKLLRRALLNLLDNAAKYSDEPVELLLRGEAGNVVFEVKDQGIGIDGADLPRLFTPFFRTDRSRARTTGGVGLGLALAKSLVEAHRGTITIASDPKSGTCVTVRIPSL
jgi:signal transduction histidine kinase